MHPKLRAGVDRMESTRDPSRVNLLCSEGGMYLLAWLECSVIGAIVCRATEGFDKSAAIWMLGNAWLSERPYRPFFAWQNGLDRSPGVVRCRRFHVHGEEYILRGLMMEGIYSNLDSVYLIVRGFTLGGDDPFAIARTVLLVVDHCHMCIAPYAGSAPSSTCARAHAPRIILQPSHPCVHRKLGIFLSTP
jgi:hypothetical protein